MLQKILKQEKNYKFKNSQKKAAKTEGKNWEEQLKVEIGQGIN